MPAILGQFDRELKLAPRSEFMERLVVAMVAIARRLPEQERNPVQAALQAYYA